MSTMMSTMMSTIHIAIAELFQMTMKYYQTDADVAESQ